MSENKSEGKENWSDFESSLGELISGTKPTDLNDALKEIQNMFLLFLNEIVDPEILLKLSADAQVNKWGTNALSSFLGDLCEEDYKKITFPEKTKYYHMYNFLFVNFNYTSLFDNYIFLDKSQFDPHRHSTVDTNFTFYPNPNDYKKEIDGILDKKTQWSSYIMTNIIHPHGYQNIPRSLLFGIEDDGYAFDRELNKFNKSYWAQNNQKYKTYFDDAELFIIYGTSIGETDSWWWKNIYDSLSSDKSELIIYYYDNNNRYTRQDVKQIFINTCKVKDPDEVISRIKNRIYVVLVNEDSNNYMFSLNNK